MGEFRCPNCGGTETTVINSRHSEAFRTRRRRKCSHCDHRFSTVELPVEEFRLMDIDGGAIAKLGKHARRITQDLNALLRQRRHLK